MKSLIGKISVVMLSLFLIGYVGYQAWKFFYDPYKTEVAVRYTVNETLRVHGIAVRTEELIFGDDAGSVSYIFEDASKVLKNTAVAYTHASSDTVENTKLADELEREIEKLKEANATGSQGYGASDLLNQQIGEAVVAMVMAGKGDTTADVYACREELLLLMNKKQILIGEESDYNDRIDTLTNQRAYLLEKVSSDSEKAAEATSTGYFISTVDGFEERVDRETLLSLPVSQIEELIDSEVVYDGDAIGKIADSYKWYYVVSLGPEEAAKFAEGQKVTAAFDGVSEDEVELVVSQIKEDDTSENSAVIFECEMMTPELSALRQVGADLLLNSFSGIRISSEAIRFNSAQQRGVYVLDRGVVRFKTTDILYEGVGYKLCRWQPGVTGSLQVFDEVFVRGSDLYEGKAIE